MECIIVDHDKVAREAIKQLISQVDFLKLKGDFDDPFTAVDFLHSESVDLVFLDTSNAGKQFFEMIKDHEHHVILIFVEAKINLSLNDFEIDNYDYHLRSVSHDQLIPQIHKAKELHDEKEDRIEVEKREYIFVRNKSVITKLNLKDILYVHALGDYVNIYTHDAQHTVHITLSGIEQKLPHQKFCRIHRSYIIALRHIDNIEEGTVYIKHHPIPIGEQFKPNLLKLIDFI